MAQVDNPVEDVVSVHERLLGDGEYKDVESEMLDGNVRAHANLPSTASEAIRHQMALSLRMLMLSQVHHTRSLQGRQPVRQACCMAE